jgi:hypothetical protein
MNDYIYNSNNEKGLLKFVGPYRLTTADRSIVGIRHPQVIKISVPIKIGTTKIYGTKILNENFIKSKKESTS